MKGRTMQLRWIGGGLAAVLAAGLMSAGQASAAPLLYETFDTYTTSANGTALPTAPGATIAYATTPDPIAFDINSNYPGPMITYNNSGKFYTTASRMNTTNPGSHPELASTAFGGGATPTPRFTLGHVIRTNDGTNASNQYSTHVLDQSAFSSGPGYGLTMVDQYSNVGNARRIQYTQLRTGTNTGVQTTITQIDVMLTKLGTNDTYNTTAAPTLTHKTDPNDQPFGLRLFDSANPGGAANTSLGNGFYLAFDETTDPLVANDTHAATVGVMLTAANAFQSAILEVSGNVDGNGDPIDDDTFYLDFGTWYRFTITTIIDNTDTAHLTDTAFTYNTVSVQPFGGSQVLLGTKASANGSNTHLGFRGATNVTSNINSVEFGELGTSVASFTGIATFDNINIVPEPATLGLLALGTTLLLPRRARRA